MQLYWQNTAADGLWDTILNWWEDAAATIAHAAIPVNGDSVAYATGETSNITLSSVSADLGSGVVDLGGAGTIIVSALGSILSGTWQNLNGPLQNSGTITGTNSPGIILHCDLTVETGGTVTGFLTSCSGAVINGGAISGGTFTGAGSSNLGGSITGGTWSGSGFTNSNDVGGSSIDLGTFTGDNFTNEAAIFAGTFSGNGFVNATGGSIAGGTFTNTNFTGTGGTWSGGAYNPTGTIAYDTLVVAKHTTFPIPANMVDPGFAMGGGTYTPNCLVTGIPAGGGGGTMGIGI